MISFGPPCQNNWSSGGLEAAKSPNIAHTLPWGAQEASKNDRKEAWAPEGGGGLFHPGNPHILPRQAHGTSYRSPFRLRKRIQN